MQHYKSFSWQPPIWLQTVSCLLFFFRSFEKVFLKQSDTPQKQTLWCLFVGTYCSFLLIYTPAGGLSVICVWIWGIWMMNDWSKIWFLNSLKCLALAFERAAKIFEVLTVFFIYLFLLHWRNRIHKYSQSMLNCGYDTK